MVIELFLIERKLVYTLHLFFLSKSYFKVPQTRRLNTAHYFIMKTPNKRELQKIASDHFSGIEFKDFMKLYKDHAKEQFSFLVNDATLQS